MHDKHPCIYICVIVIIDEDDLVLENADRTYIYPYTIYVETVSFHSFIAFLTFSILFAMLYFFASFLLCSFALFHTNNIRKQFRNTCMLKLISFDKYNLCALYALNVHYIYILYIYISYNSIQYDTQNNTIS